MPRRKPLQPLDDLGDLQLQVLQTLWQLGKGTVYDVLDALPEEGPPRYNTILTVLRSLEKRGLVEHTTQERTFVFRPCLSREDLQQGMLRDFLERIFGGSPRSLVATLLDATPVTAPELAELKRLIAAREQTGNGTRDT
jgi:predicted transcriptional regulator